MATERSLSSVTRQHNINKPVRGMNIYPDWGRGKRKNNLNRKVVRQCPSNFPRAPQHSGITTAWTWF